MADASSGRRRISAIAPCSAVSVRGPAVLAEDWFFAASETAAAGGWVGVTQRLAAGFGNRSAVAGMPMAKSRSSERSRLFIIITAGHHRHWQVIITASD